MAAAVTMIIPSSDWVSVPANIACRWLLEKLVEKLACAKGKLRVGEPGGEARSWSSLRA